MLCTNNKLKIIYLLTLSTSYIIMYIIALTYMKRKVSVSKMLGTASDVYCINERTC